MAGCRGRRAFEREAARRRRGEQQLQLEMLQCLPAWYGLGGRRDMGDACPAAGAGAGTGSTRCQPRPRGDTRPCLGDTLNPCLGEEHASRGCVLFFATPPGTPRHSLLAWGRVSEG